MSKIKKTDLLQLVQEQAEMIAELSGMVELNKRSIIKLENEREKPQLKQLDQSDDIAKELLEVDLSSELTGSDLAKDYFKRGCCPRVCFVGEDDDECLSDLMVAMVIGYVEGKGFETSYHDFFPCAAMINSYGDELKASQVGS